MLTAHGGRLGRRRRRPRAISFHLARRQFRAFDVDDDRRRRLRPRRASPVPARHPSHLLGDDPRPLRWLCPADDVPVPGCRLFVPVLPVLVVPVVPVAVAHDEDAGPGGAFIRSRPAFAPAAAPAVLVSPLSSPRRRRTPWGCRVPRGGTSSEYLDPKPGGGASAVRRRRRRDRGPPRSAAGRRRRRRRRSDPGRRRSRARASRPTTAASEEILGRTIELGGIVGALRASGGGAAARSAGAGSRTPPGDLRDPSGRRLLPRVSPRRTPPVSSPARPTAIPPCSPL